VTSYRFQSYPKSLIMAKILIITHGRVAMFHTCANLAKQLVDAGHSVIYASPDEIGPRAAAADLPYLQLPPSQFPPEHDSALDGHQGTRRQLQQAAIEAMGVFDLPARIQRIDPDLLLLDIELHAHILRCIPLGIPIGLLSPFISIVKRSRIPPLHSSAIPGQGWRGSAMGIEWLWARFRVRKLVQYWLAPRRFSGLDRVSLLRRLAARDDLRFREEVTPWNWLIPFSYRRLPVLSLTPNEMNFSSTPDPGTQHCGALVDRTRPDDDSSSTTRSRLEAIYRRRRSGTSDALILCSLSTFLDPDPGFVGRVVSAVEGQPGWEMILATGTSLALEEVGPLPDRVHAFDWIPQMEVLGVADCAVINAGTSVYECILRGVPMVVYSLQFNDQNGNAARVGFHGLGVVGDKDHDDASTMQSHIRHVLSDESYRQRVVAMRRQLEAYDFEARAVRAVESLLPAGGTHPPER
jgi:zeaxanthin glucosyltransferase